MQNESVYRIGAVKNGFNLDHIPAGNALHIIQLLKLTQNKHIVGVGFNLNSTKLGHKDLIKVEDLELTPEQLNLISLFAIGATYSVIKNRQVVSKFTIELADSIDDLIICPNFRCISLHSAKSKFISSYRYNGDVILKCHYCESEYRTNQISSYNI